MPTAKPASTPPCWTHATEGALLSQPRCSYGSVVAQGRRVAARTAPGVPGYLEVLAGAYHRLVRRRAGWLPQGDEEPGDPTPTGPGCGIVRRPRARCWPTVWPLLGRLGAGADVNARPAGPRHAEDGPLTAAWPARPRRPPPTLLTLAPTVWPAEPRPWTPPARSPIAGVDGERPGNAEYGTPLFVHRARTDFRGPTPGRSATRSTTAFADIGGGADVLLRGQSPSCAAPWPAGWTRKGLAAGRRQPAASSPSPPRAGHPGRATSRCHGNNKSVRRADHRGPGQASGPDRGGQRSIELERVDGDRRRGRGGAATCHAPGDRRASRRTRTSSSRPPTRTRNSVSPWHRTPPTRPGCPPLRKPWPRPSGTRASSCWACTATSAPRSSNPTASPSPPKSSWTSWPPCRPSTPSCCPSWTSEAATASPTPPLTRPAPPQRSRRRWPPSSVPSAPRSGYFRSPDLDRTGPRNRRQHDVHAVRGRHAQDRPRGRPGFRSRRSRRRHYARRYVSVDGGMSDNPRPVSTRIIRQFLPRGAPTRPRSCPE